MWILSTKVQSDEPLLKFFLRLQSRKWITVDRMANIYKGWLCEKSLKTPLLATHFNIFWIRSKPSLLTVISMDPRPTNYLRQNIVFSYPEMIRVSFSLFLSLSVFCYFTLLLIFIKIILLLLLFFIFFMKIIFIFSCSGMFRNVPCSWFYWRPFSPAKMWHWVVVRSFS